MSAPALGYRWYAARGMGAWLISDVTGRQPRRLRVSTIDRVSDVHLLFRSVGDMRASRVAGGFDRLLGEVQRDRAYGEFWGYGLVAQCGADVMLEQDLGPWDLAAPWVIIEEAGGAMTDLEGRRSLAAGEALATNGIIHGSILERLWRG
jgi:histidinol-phosphatase